MDECPNEQEFVIYQAYSKHTCTCVCRSEQRTCPQQQFNDLERATNCIDNISRNVIVRQTREFNR